MSSVLRRQSAKMDSMSISKAEGRHFSEQLICSRCVSDPYLRQRIQHAASVSPCTFCHGRGRHSAPFDTLMEIIEGTIFQYYNHAVNEAGWDSREGGYLGDTFDTWELIGYRLDELSDREAMLGCFVPVDPALPNLSWQCRPSGAENRLGARSLGSPYPM